MNSIHFVKAALLQPWDMSRASVWVSECTRSAKCFRSIHLAVSTK